METSEEYLPIRVVNQVGEFVGEVREAYLDLLRRIEKTCFLPVHFMFDQSNRLEAKIQSELGVAAEFPWADSPDAGTFKCVENQKWFALILTVAFGKLGGDTHDEEELVEAVNLKADPEAIPQLTKRSGIYPAYHMNKKHWISVILDDTLPDEDVMELIRQSYSLACQSNPARLKSNGAWMIPSNPKIYDVDRGFEDGGGVIEWHQHNQIQAGDEVYIYSSAPYSAIRYRCEVVEAGLLYDGMFKESKGYPKAMKIRLMEKYPPDKYPLSFIKAHGGSVVRSARSMPKKLHDAIKSDKV